MTKEENEIIRLLGLILKTLEWQQKSYTSLLRGLGSDVDEN